MCTNGLNQAQLKMMVEQMDDQVGLNRRWVHKMYHAADDAGMALTAAKLKEAQEALDGLRATLLDAQDAIDHDSRNLSDVHVSLV